MHRFAVVDFVIRRDQPGIGDHPIDPVGAEGTGITQVMELQRCRPQRQHAGAAVVGVAHQIDQHIDAIAADAVGDRLAAVAGHHCVVVHAAADQLGGLIGDIGQGIGEHLKAAAVVAGEQAMEQVAHGVIAKIGREVADPPAFAGPMRRGRRQPQGGHAAVGGLCPAFAEALVQGRGRRKQVQAQGRHQHRINNSGPGLAVGLQLRQQPGHAALVVVPVAEAEPVHLQLHQHFGGIGIEG